MGERDLPQFLACIPAVIPMSLISDYNDNLTVSVKRTDGSCFTTTTVEQISHDFGYVMACWSSCPSANNVIVATVVTYNVMARSKG